MLRAALSTGLYWVSLGLSAGAVVLFLWLIRDESRPEEKKDKF